VDVEVGIEADEEGTGDTMELSPMDIIPAKSTLISTQNSELNSISFVGLEIPIVKLGQ
jgi:hypothetical protein